MYIERKRNRFITAVIIVAAILILSGFGTVVSGASKISDSGSTATVLTAKATAKTGYINDSEVAFRSKPSISSDTLIRWLSYGERVTITGTSGSWTSVIIGGRSGYVYSTYVTADSSGSSSGGSGGSSGGGSGSSVKGTGVINDTGVRYRSSPNGSVLGTIPMGTEVQVTGVSSVDNLWYSIIYNGKTVYVYSAYVDLEGNYTYDKDFEYALSKEGFPESYKAELRKLHSIHPKWVFKADQTGLDWNTVIDKENGYSGSTKYNVVYYTFDDVFKAPRQSWETDYGYEWCPASRYAIEYYMDPRKFIGKDSGVFQFITSKYDASQTLEGVQSIIQGTFMDGRNPGSGYSSYAELFIYAGRLSGVNPYMLASMVVNEQSAGGSPSSLGTSPYDGYYNFFNIGASDGINANYYGAQYAKNHGWDTPAKSIIGGAKWFASNFVNNNQYTPYLKKFNVMNGIGNVPYNQYFTNVSGAWQEGRTQAAAYSSMMNQALTFSIPVFRNMPGNDMPVEPEKPVEPEFKWTYSGGYWYLYHNGTMVKNTWMWVDGKCYYLYSDGKMASSEWIGNYYVNGSGVWIKNKWVKDGNGWWYKYGDGTYPKNQMVEIGGHSYYFGNNGYMQIGLQNVGNSYYYFDDNGYQQKSVWKYLDNKWYWFDESGKMVSDCWKEIGGSYYYFYKDGHIAVSEYVDGWYLDKNGRWTEGQWKRNSAGWWYLYDDGTYPVSVFVKLGSGTFYFNQSGYMVTGWKKIDGSWYLFNESGYMKTGWYKDSIGRWFYMDNKGKMYQNTWLKINDKWYYFYGDGHMASDEVVDGYKLSSSGAMI